MPHLPHLSSCAPKTARRPGLLSASLLLLLGTAGCSRLKQQVKQAEDTNPQLRQAAIASSRKSCVQAATAKAPKLPGMDVRIQQYCDCFSTKGLEKFSNSELTEIGLHGGHFTPDEQSKLMQGVQICQNQLLGHRQ